MIICGFYFKGVLSRLPVQIFLCFVSLKEKFKNWPKDKNPQFLAHPREN